MCFGGGSKAPPKPEPVAPNPPQVTNTTEQTEPQPSEEDNTVSNIQSKFNRHTFRFSSFFSKKA